MKLIVIIIVILNNLIWFAASIGMLNNLTKGIIPVPTKPTMSHVILSFIMLLMNILVLLYVLKKTNTSVNPRKEVNMKKLFIGLGWFLVIYIVGSFMIGMVLGAMAGSTAATPAAGAEAGRASSIDFFHKYGIFIFLGSVIAASVGTATGWLPLTKDEEPAQPSVNQ